MAGSRAQQAAIAISMKKKGKIPKGYHKMPDGRIMKDSAHKKAKMQNGGVSKDIPWGPKVELKTPSNSISNKLLEPTRESVFNSGTSKGNNSDSYKNFKGPKLNRKPKKVSKVQKGGTSWKRQDPVIKEQDLQAAKSSSDYYKSRADHLRKVQKVYPNVDKFNELKNYYNKKAVEANKEKVKINASKYKKGGSTAAWTRKEGKNPEGGLNAKGVASYRAENPGSKLQTAVTTKPSKLKAGSKDAKRRKSFCSRMEGMKKKLTSSKTANDPNSRINKSLRKWNC